MTLKEKFDSLVPIEFGGMQEPLLTECEQIADEFAVGFAEWLHDEWIDDERWSKITDPKELLEIYKKTL